MASKTPFSLAILITFFLFHSAPSFAQSPAAAPAPVLPSAPAPAPAPPGPPDITHILQKSGQFTSFIRLLRSTHVADQIYHQLNDTNNVMTVFAPADNAFSALKSGTLNSLSDEQQDELIQYHVLPTLIPSTQFQTVSNPLRTLAGSTEEGEFPLNVTTAGDQVNITTGVDNTTVSGTVYMDDQLAVYQVDNVLLPEGIFKPKPPAPAPAPGIAKEKGKEGDEESADADAPAKNSGVGSLAVISRVAGAAVGVLIAVFCL